MIHLLIVLIVECFVLLPSCYVIHSFLDQCDQQHEGQGCYVGKKIADFQSWDELRERDKKEEQVVEELELVEQHDWDEGDQIVLVIIEFVSHVSAWSPVAG